MANENTPTKSDLEDIIDEACGILAQAYDPMTTREDAMQAIADALDALEGNGNGEDAEEEEDVEESDDDGAEEEEE